MKKRIRKSRQLYYIVYNKSSQEGIICSTGMMVANIIGVNRTTLYKHFLNSNTYEKDEYIIIANVPILLCNKGLGA